MNIVVLKNTLEVNEEIVEDLLRTQDLMFDVLNEEPEPVVSIGTEAVIETDDATILHASETLIIPNTTPGDYVAWGNEDQVMATPRGFAWWNDENDIAEYDEDDQTYGLTINEAHGPYADFLQVPQFRDTVAAGGGAGDLIMADDAGNIWGYRYDGEGNVHVLNREQTLAILIQDERNGSQNAPVQQPS